MRIVQVSDFFPPTPGGMEAHVARLSKHLAGGNEVVVVAGGAASESDLHLRHRVVRARTVLDSVPGIYERSDRLFVPPLRDPVFSRAIDRVVREMDANIVHAHGWSAVPAAAVCARRGLPLCVTLHDYGFLCPLRTLLRDGRRCPHISGIRCVSCPGAPQGVVKRLALAAAINRCSWPAHTEFLAVSSFVAQMHLDHRRAWPVEVVPNFIDVPTEIPGPTPVGGPILFIGPDDPYKGLRLAERAVQLLRKTDPKRTLHHVGGSRTTPSDPSYIRRSGRLEGPELLEAFRTAAVVLVPPLWDEPCPTIVLEAMCAGRPIVGTAVGGMPDLVVQGVNGVLCPTDDPGALAGTLATVLGDPLELVAMGVRSYERAARFGSDEIVPRLEATYRRMIRGKEERSGT